MTPITSDPLARALQDLLARTVGEDSAIRGGVMRVEAPGFSWEGASGAADPEKGDAIIPGDQFQAASVTKMITAATFMTLVEENRLDLDSGIGGYLPAAVLSGLHELDGRDRAAEITPRQLLSHTSGIADFFGDGEPGPGGALPFVAEMRAEPPISAGRGLALRRHRLRARRPDHRAGERDGAACGDARENPRPASHGSHLHAVPPARPARRGGPRAVLRLRRRGPLWRPKKRLRRLGRRRSRHHRGRSDPVHPRLREDRLFRSPGSRAAMLSWTPTGEPGVDYGLGVRRFVIEDLGMPGFGEIWGHTGFLKSFMLYWPARDATICGTLNQSAAPGAFSRLRPAAAIVPAAMCKLDQHGG